MRVNKFHEMVTETYNMMQSYFVNDDQDVLNIILAHFPEKMLNLPIQYNFHRNMCIDSKDVISKLSTISILHGITNSFHSGVSRFNRQGCQIFREMLCHFEVQKSTEIFQKPVLLKKLNEFFGLSDKEKYFI